MLLGDSFTFGLGVGQEETFTSQLDSRGECDYYNAGSNGYATDMHAAYLNKYFDQFEFDHVVVNTFVGNDFTELRRHRIAATKNSIPSRVYDTEVFVKDSALHSRNKAAPKSLALHVFGQKWEVFMKRLNVSSDLDEPTLTWPIFLADDHIAQDPNLDDYKKKTRKYFLGIRDFLEERDTPLLVNIIPMDVQVSQSYWDKYPGTPFDQEAFVANRPQKWLTALFDEGNIDYVDLLDVFRADPRRDELYFDEFNSHFNEYGHEVTAGVILSAVESDKQPHE